MMINFNSYDNIKQNIMSIYSGFATRQQEQAYDSIVCDLIEVLQRRLMKFYAGEEADQVKFHAILTNIQTHLIKMEENKYLEPKMSNTFKEIIVVTAAAAEASGGQQTTPHVKGAKQPSLPKQSLSFVSEKLNNQFRNLSFGKIRHQVTSKEDGLSSRGEANPEFLVIDKNVKRAASTHFSKESVQRRQMQRWGAMFDNQSVPAPTPQQTQKKNLQYIIRQYVSRGRNRKKFKK